MKKIFIIHILLAMPLLAWCDNITFADAEVKAICVKNWDTNGDGELSYEEAAAVTDLGTVFNSSAIIKSFDELQYFVGLRSIRKESFKNCNSLTSVSIPTSVTSIGQSAFSRCSSLTSIDIPTSVTSIGGYAFSGCSSLTSIDIPNSVNSIERGTFYMCSSLTSVILPNSLTAIGIQAFQYCSSLTSVTIPNSVITIGQSAFRDCSSLASITIPNSVTSIEGFAFASCPRLTSLILPNSLSSMDDEVFWNSPEMRLIIVESTKPFSIQSETFPSSCVIFVPNGCKEVYQSVALWNNYTISDQNPDEAIVFADTNVKEICVKNWDTNGDGELSYGEAALVSSVQQVFSNNTDITSFDELQYFYTLNSIGEYAFDKCTNLKSVKLPDNLKKIDKYAFSYCNALKSIVIPKSVNSIYWYRVSSSGETIIYYCNPFIGCNSLESIVVESGNDSFDSRDNCNAIIEKSTNTLVSGCKNTVIPNSVRILGFSAFVGCEDLVSVVIPYNVSDIQKGAFADCKNLSMITIDGGIKKFSGTELLDKYWYGKIIKGTFEGCSNLKKVIVKNLADWSKSSFGDSPLDYTHHLYSDENTEIIDLVIPNSVDSIGYRAFANCSYLKSATIPNSVKVIGRAAFEGCSSLTSVTISNSVKVIETSAFSQCTSLTSVTIPNSVTSIGYWAFDDCSSLISVTIPNSVTSIGSPFHRCTRLSAIIWDADFAMPNDIVNTNTTNMLFYTKDASYAPSSIKNIIVNGAAKEIVLSDANSSNNFYCPREFTAEKISYTHNYRMTSGLDGQARGWETIALPFTVSEITHSSKGKLLPFGAWTSTSDAKPFWLCSLSSSGFIHATSIEANTPYIICMPNNSDYDSSFNLSGNVTFSATNVKVPVSSSVNTVKSNGKSFVPAFCAQEKASGVYALNVSNGYHSELGGYTEGSAFVSDLRKVSPFEAYMTTSDSNAKRAFLIDFSETTGIGEIPTTDMKDGTHKIYNLNGQLMKQTNSQQELNETLRQLPAGVYVVNGKKTIIK